MAGNFLGVAGAIGDVGGTMPRTPPPMHAIMPYPNFYGYVWGGSPPINNNVPMFLNDIIPGFDLYGPSPAKWFQPGSGRTIKIP